MLLFKKEDALHFLKNSMLEGAHHGWQPGCFPRRLCTPGEAFLHFAFLYVHVTGGARTSPQYPHMMWWRELSLMGSKSAWHGSIHFGYHADRSFSSVSRVVRAANLSIVIPTSDGHFPASFGRCFVGGGARATARMNGGRFLDLDR